MLGLTATLVFLITPPPAQGVDVPANGRAWELVTPSEPVSAQVSGVVPFQGDDSRLAYHSIGPMPGAVSGQILMSSNIAERHEDGWTSTPLGFRFSVLTQDFFVRLVPILPAAFSDDRLTSLWTSSVPLTPDSPPEEQTALYRLAADGSLEMIAPLSEKPLIEFEGLTHLSGDGERAIFTSQRHLLAADASRTSGESVYEWDGAGLHLLDVDNSGSLLSACGSVVPESYAGRVPHSGAVSNTSNRVFFVNPANPGCGGTKRVYLREGGSSTVEVSASHCTRLDCNPPRDVAFAGATPSGGSVFLTTTQQLANDDTDEGRDLYRYDVGSETLTLLTPAQPGASGEVEESYVYPSPDGMRVYFKASGQLIAGEGPALEGNLHLADQSGLHFVAPEVKFGRVEVVRDGHSALLSTLAALTADDTDAREDVYLYDADDATTTFLSVGPSGGGGPFDADLQAPIEEGGPLAGGENPGYRSITDDGRDAFFSTAEKLVPEDGNDVTDVYEWKEGHVGLVSSGTGVGPASFGGVSADGRTVVFKTTATLTSDDHDGGDGDLYTARIGGGFPPEKSEAPACTGTACDRPTRASLERPIPSSASPRRRGQGGRIRLRSAHWREGSGDAISITASVPSAGRVSAMVWTPGGKGKRTTLARGSEGAIRPGRIRVLLRLTDAGHRMLAREGRLVGRLLVRVANRELDLPLHLAAGA